MVRGNQPVVEQASPGAPKATPRRWRVPAAALLVLGVMAVTGLLGGEAPLGDERVAPGSLLDPPSDPAGTPTEPSGTPDAATIGPLADGWARLDLPGPAPLWALASGDGGWAAVTGTDPPAVWVSPNAATWLHRALPAGARVDALSLAVSGGSLAIVTTSFEEGGAESTAWLSEDGGRSWMAVPFSTPAVVMGIEHLSSGWIAFGSEGPDPDGTGRRLRGGDNRPAVWRLEADRVVPYDFLVDPGPGGEVRAVVELQGRMVALGRAFTGPRAWNVRDGTLSPVIPTTPVESPAFGFASAAVVEGGRVAATLVSRSGADSRLVVSADLNEWTEVESPGPGTVSRLDEAGDRVIGLPGGFGPLLLVVSTEGSVWEGVFASDPGTGLGSVAAFAGATGAGNVIVLGGEGPNGAALWVWGEPGDLGWVVQGPPAGGGRWLRVAQAQNAEPDRFLSAVVIGNEGLIGGMSQVWWIPDLAEPERLIPARLYVRARLVEVGGEVFAIHTESAHGRVSRYTGEARWETWDLWDGAVVGVTRLGGRWIAFGQHDNGSAVIATSDDLEAWSEPLPQPDAAGGPWAAFSFEGAVSRSMFEGTQISFDGQRFVDVPGFPLGWPQGSAALVDPLSGGGYAVTFPGEERRWEVPAVNLSSVYRAGDRLVALDSSRALVETEDGWDERPLDLGHGIFGSVETLLAAGDGTLFAVGSIGEDLTLWRWQP